MLYNIAIYIYMLGVAVGSLFKKKIRLMWRGERDAVRLLRERVDPTAQYVWFHAASLGEFEQGRPLIERLRDAHPEYKILLTFFSPSGYEVRKNYADADIVCYLPLDTRRNARRFLRAVRPVMAFFIKYEFWYNYLHILRHRGVPTYSVSSIFRPSQIFFRPYGRGYARVLRCFTRFFVQNETSRTLLASIGIDNVEVTGDTRFDRVVQIRDAHKRLPIVEAFKGGTSRTEGGVFVAGSSWPPDESLFMPYFEGKQAWKVVVAPHVVSEEHIAQIAAMTKKKVVRYTQTTPVEAAEADVLIIDCFGLLSSVYAYADLVAVGGGFGVGIHNVLEAAVWGVPVMFGPNNKRFDEAQGLIACGGGYEIADKESFAAVADHLIDDTAARRRAADAAATYVVDRSGAVDAILSSLNL